MKEKVKGALFTTAIGCFCITAIILYSGVDVSLFLANVIIAPISFGLGYLISGVKY